MKIYIALLVLFLTFFITGVIIASDFNQGKTFKIVIDPGHGGKDPGTVVNKVREKDVVLDVALRLGSLIEQNTDNVKLTYTRNRDVYITLYERAQIANKINADLFISIHSNYCPNPSVKGTETYVLGLHRSEDNLNVAKKENSVILLEEDFTTRYEGFDPNSSESYIMFELLQDNNLDQSVDFASILQSNFKSQAQRNDREVRQAGFLVLRETSMPSVLIETGYLSNQLENSYLQTSEGRENIALSIYKSLYDYLKKIDNRLAVETKPSVPDLDLERLSDKKKEIIKKDPDQKKTKPKVEPITKPKPKVEPITKLKESEKKAPEMQPDPTVVKYAIQIGVYKNKISLKSPRFKGMKGIFELKIDNLYKYYCYDSNHYEEVKNNFAEVRKLFSDAFIVKIVNNRSSMYVAKGNK